MKRPLNRSVSRRIVRRKAQKANRKKGASSPGLLTACAPWFVRLSGVVFLAFLLIFLHDGLMQTRFFGIQKIDISGLENLERAEVLLKAEIPEKANLYGLRLDQIRTRLETHPFIREAQLSRHFPGTLEIRIEEQKPFALLYTDLIETKVFLANAQGQIFKKLENKPEMYGDHVLIHGLPMVGEKENRFWFNRAKDFIELWRREMDPLLGPDQNFSLRVDPDLGLFVNHTGIARQISFGVSDFPPKIQLLKSFMAFRQMQKNKELVDRIDLNEKNRIVLVPTQTENLPQT